MLKERENTLKTGTTTVGLVGTDGVVLASDRRATMGHFIASKDVQKVFQIDNTIAMTVAGSVGDAQSLVRMLKAECKLYRLKYGKQISVKSASTLLANIMFQYKFFPYYVQLIVAGVSPGNKPEMFSIDAIGGTTQETCTSTGSGSPMAYGLLEDSYKEGNSNKDNVKLAAKAISTAMKRDSASGEFVDVVEITEDGFKRLEKNEVAKLIAN